VAIVILALLHTFELPKPFKMKTYQHSNRVYKSRCSSILALFLLISVRESASASASACLGGSVASVAATDQNGKERTWPDCGLYMAESTIPGSGLGMYAGRHFRPGSQIAYGDVVLQVADFEVHNRLRKWYHGDFAAREGDEEWLLDDYFWNSRLTSGSFEALETNSILPGVGMLPNSYPGLVNTNIRAPGRTADLHRGRDPGTGASTTYHNSLFQATQEIEPGAEIFMDYGSNWFKRRTEEFGLIPLRKDFAKADALLKKFWKITGGNIDTELANDTWALTWRYLKDEPRAATAMPKDMADVKCAIETGTAKRSHPNRIQSLEWIEENGQCLDNIRPASSTIQQAGGGAFATRKMEKGQVIAPMPLLHFRRNQLEVYSSAHTDFYDGDVRKIGSQLLLNYAYSHPESSLLLFPYSPVVNYVNHDATKVNAELRWSSAFASHHADWLERTPDDLECEPHAGLIMELVATRDIQDGDEVFLDYGQAWEQAWQDYVKNKWRPTPEDEAYVSATQLNLNVRFLKTRTEIEGDEAARSVLANVYTVCYIKLIDKPAGTDGKVKVDWRYHPALTEAADNAYPCDVVERTIVETPDDLAGNGLDNTYTVVLKVDENNLKSVEGIPRAAIRFVDQRYTSDQFLPTAFRHTIGIPDHMVPEAWRDMPKISPMTSGIVSSWIPVTFMSYTWWPSLPLSVVLVGVAYLFSSQKRLRKVTLQLAIAKRPYSYEPGKKSSTPSADCEACSESSSKEPLLRHRPTASFWQ
jgi:hypothetical protein